ncbi:Gfo/Idh/MocA family oxidoreductase [Roseiarcaceae bacterium H3SJ34-1]|uniref:Gfo/Idh/MocA family protein n=1 Tax=Terripilifer ovatus TaxID=3032367 RepID=UPI003AB98002|nr:Gfo/Idh/MocA family oxidoreductase [Roseiarcaceae bacterium H3SJ34-1]
MDAGNQSQREKKKGFLRYGVVGVGIGASSVLPAIASSPWSTLYAGADTDAGTRERFRASYPGARIFSSIGEICADPNIDVIWIATPNRFHAAHACAAAQAGKHVIVSKPMATSLAEAATMVETCDKAGVKLIAGHSLGFSPAIRTMASMAQPQTAFGAPRTAQLMAFTDWMLLPRTPEEIDPAQGGGLVLRQSSHQLDAARLLCGGVARSVRAHVGAWMPARKGPGFFSAFLHFDNDAVATVSHNGYGYLVGPEVAAWGSDVGISGNDIAHRNAARRLIRGGANESALKDAMRLGGSSPLFRHEGRAPYLPLHLGLVFVSCERGDLRHAPFGVYAYGDEGRSEIPASDDGSYLGLSEVEEMYAAVVDGAELYRDGFWGMATLEATMAIIESSRLQREVTLKHQVPVRRRALEPATALSHLLEEIQCQAQN